MRGLVWANSGLQQIHMPLGEPEETTQRVRGTVGLSFEDLAALRRRLREHGIEFEEDSGGVPSKWFGPAIRLQTPTGVQLRAHASREPFGPPEALAAGTTLPGGPTLGNGMPYVEFACATGGAAAICRFYRQTLGVPVEEGAGTCAVPIGRQRLLFRETGDELPDYDGHHVAVYVGDIATGDHSKSFAEMYQRCRDAGHIYNNPRFPHLRYDTLQDVIRLGEFRILDLVDPETGRTAYTLEHEIRSLEHPGFSGKALLRKSQEEL